MCLSRRTSGPVGKGKGQGGKGKGRQHYSSIWCPLNTEAIAQLKAMNNPPPHSVGIQHLTVLTTHHHTPIPPSPPLPTGHTHHPSCHTQRPLSIPATSCRERSRCREACAQGRRQSAPPPGSSSLGYGQGPFCRLESRDSPSVARPSNQQGREEGGRKIQ